MTACWCTGNTSWLQNPPGTSTTLSKSLTLEPVAAPAEIGTAIAGPRDSACIMGAICDRDSAMTIRHIFLPATLGSAVGNRTTRRPQPRPLNRVGPYFDVHAHRDLSLWGRTYRRTAISLSDVPWREWGVSSADLGRKRAFRNDGQLLVELREERRPQ